MKFTDIFIKRPVLAICINIIIFVFGLTSIQTLPTRQYPKSDLSVVNVTTSYVGASADLVRGYITTPLERVIASADGIDYISSTSVQGLSTIKAHLVLNYDVGDALTQIQAKVAQVRNDLPPSAEAPVIDVESTDNRFASMYLSFYSEVLDSGQIADYLTRVVQPKLSSVLGVQKAEILGSTNYAMRIWLDATKIAQLEISPLDIQNALQNNNYLSAVGQLKGQYVITPLVTNTDLTSVEEFENLVIKGSGSSLVRLKEIATIELGSENYDSDIRFDGKKAIFMGIYVLPNANSLEVINNVRKILPDIEKNLPEGLRSDIPYDATRYIQSAISDVTKTLLETVLIVIVVIYLFMGSLRSVLVPVVAIPLSLVGAVGLMALFGFTINLLTLLAIVLAVGLVVDDAIVMLENVETNIKKGHPPLEAAIIGARELVVPIIAMTITLAAVYAPIGIQGGLTGALFKEFAFTLSGAVLVSGFVALTLSPMMSSRLLQSTHKKESTFKQISDRTLEKIKEKYTRALTYVLQYRHALVTFATLYSLIAVPLFVLSGKELAPTEDQGVVFGIVQTSPNSTLEQTTRFTQMTYDLFKSFDEYRTSFQISNPTGGFSGMITKPWNEREKTTIELQKEAWQKALQIPGIRLIMTTPAPLPGGSDFPVEMTVQSTDDISKMLPLAQELVSSAFASGSFMYADTDLKVDYPQAKIEFDRDKVSSLGLNLQSVGNDLSVYLGGNYINRFSVSGRSYKVIPQLQRNDRMNPEQLSSLHIRGPEGKLIPLDTVARVFESVEPRELNKFQQLNSFKIYGLPTPGTTTDKALTVLEEKAKEILPFGYTLDYPGESRQLRKEGSSLVTTLLLAFVFIYLVLASQFESFRDPFIIIFGSVPLALTSALIFPYLSLTTINIYSQVGLITLVGLVSKNGILMVEFANHLKEQGIDRYNAIIQAGASRLRPILMTSVATVVGHFPLIIASGAGAASRNSIGIVLVTGMVIGTFFTLFILPAIYIMIAKENSNVTK